MLNRPKLIREIQKFSSSDPETRDIAEFLNEACAVGLIRENELIDGYYYEGIGINASIARWDAKNKIFHFNFYRRNLPKEIKNAVHIENKNTAFEFFFPYKIIKEPKDYYRVDYFRV